MDDLQGGGKGRKTGAAVSDTLILNVLAIINTRTAFCW